ncbi:MAG TPA: 30S ribosomal protein S12 methylthiotransferase RimO [Candidatus Eisenbacteria bacterium]|nr:30S ribosomal protein S12 methylthiotransferase RimO [Candidatus Eisenbacteria bacterium]
MKSSPTLAFVTLGCPKNQVDSENMLGLMVRDGFRTVADPAEADVAVVNTCAFLQSAVRESRDTIASIATLKREGSLKGLIVTGCLAQRAGGDLLTDFPEVDAVLGTGQWKEVVRAARHVLAPRRKGAPERFSLTDDPGGALDPDSPRALSTPRHLAYLKISEGCDHRCTFCIIPRLRGDQKSRPLPEIVAEARRLVAEGVREINLIGQDTTGWGSDLPGKPDLADLLEALDSVEGLAWIRVQYTYPRLWSDRLIETWASARRVVPYVDIPLQHIAADMLRRMARGMNAKDTRALIRRIKDGIPGVAIRTNFIVGFPGETDAEFDELLAYVEEERFDHVVVFTYEREPETPSHGMDGQVHIGRRRSRRARLLALQQKISAERLRERVGRSTKVMVDGRAGRPSAGTWAARTPGQAFEVDGGVMLEGEDLVPGEVIDARVTGASAYDLFARAEAAPLLHVVGHPS